jgi:3-(3-hydroxy-phenyl)propionate hydroxylase
MYDVAVVGLGPVGSLLALLLGQAGMHVLAVDREPRPHPLPRAIATDDDVLRILRALPDGQEILDAMLLDCAAVFVGADGRQITDIRFPGSGPGLPGLATFHQPTLERQLGERLNRLPRVEVRRGVEVCGLVQDADACTVSLTGGPPVRARFVVGCDGAGSVVRRLAALPLRGRRFRQRWLVVDSDLPHGRRDRPAVAFSCSPAQPTVSLPQPGGHRWEFLLRDAEGVDDRRTAALLAAAGADPAEIRLARSAVYTYSAALAGRWRDRRILLAGDAAHLMPPFAGQGVSAGMRDAAALAWRLDLVSRGLAGTHLLGGYQAERAPHVQAMTRLALFTGWVVQTRSPWVAWVRDGLLRAVDRSPGTGRWLRGGGPRARVRLPRHSRLTRGAGRLLPAVDVRQPDGSLVPLDRLISGRHALIARDDALAGLSAADRRWWTEIGVVPLAVGRAGDTVPGLRRLLRGNRVLAVRPDRYVIAAVAPSRLAAVTAAYAATMTGATGAGPAGRYRRPAPRRGRR